MQEIWKDIKGYEGLYKISNLGRLKSFHKNKWKLRKGYITIGYYYYGFYKKNIRSFKSIHRLVALNFIPNPENKPQVNHIDGVKLNNNISNLEWCTASENQLHAYKMGLTKPQMLGRKGINNPLSKPIECYKNGIKIRTYISLSEASQETGIVISNISNVALGIGYRKTAGGYYWKYVL